MMQCIKIQFILCSRAHRQLPNAPMSVDTLGRSSMVVDRCLIASSAVVEAYFCHGDLNSFGAVVDR